MEPSARVYVIADYEPLRRGLADVIGDAQGIELAGEAGSIPELLLDPRHIDAEIGLIDLDTVQPPGPDWSAGASPILFTRAVFLGGKPRNLRLVLDWIKDLDGLSAVGLVDKDGSALRLADTIRLVHAGAVVLPSEFASPLLRRYARLVRAPDGGREEHLSDRELEVARLVARGFSNKQIASELTVSEGTVKAHVSHILAKLGISHRAELIGYVLASDLSA
ncbi:MAG: LuxR C-terminal-related transcriptional regulator [Tepidiformaceae bacterium]